MQRAILLFGFLCAFGMKGNAQLVDTTLSRQLHVRVQPMYNELFMRDTTTAMTVTFTGGVTDRWVRLSVWLYGRGDRRTDLNERTYYLKGDDYDAFWAADGLTKAYQYCAEKLGLVIVQ